MGCSRCSDFMGNNRSRFLYPLWTRIFLLYTKHAHNSMEYAKKIGACTKNLEHSLFPCRICRTICDDHQRTLALVICRQWPSQTLCQVSGLWNTGKRAQANSSFTLYNSFHLEFQAVYFACALLLLALNTNTTNNKHGLFIFYVFHYSSK